MDPLHCTVVAVQLRKGWSDATLILLLSRWAEQQPTPTFEVPAADLVDWLEDQD